MKTRAVLGLSWDFTKHTGLIACVFRFTSQWLWVGSSIGSVSNPCESHGVPTAHRDGLRHTQDHRVPAVQQYIELAAQHGGVPPLCSRLTTETLPLCLVLVHWRRSTPSLPGANEADVPKGRRHLGSGCKPYIEGHG